MLKSASLAFLVVALGAASAHAASPSPTDIFRSHCIAFLQGARTQAAAGGLAEKAGYALVEQTPTGRTFRTPVGDLIFTEMTDGQRFCEIYLPLDVSYPQLILDVKTMTKTLPDGPYVMGAQVGPDVEAQRIATWDGKRYDIEIGEEFYNDDQIHIFLGGQTPRIRK